MPVSINVDSGKLWNYTLTVTHAQETAEQYSEELQQTLKKLIELIRVECGETTKQILAKKAELVVTKDREERNSLRREIEELQKHERQMKEKGADAEGLMQKIRRGQEQYMGAFRKGKGFLNGYLTRLDALGLAKSSGGGKMEALASENGFQMMSFRGMTCYARDSEIDLEKTDGAGRTNLQRMEQGCAPLGKDGLPINLHHMQQSETKGGLMELSSTTHHQNHGMLHINSGSNIPSGINRSAFAKMKQSYWKQRAQYFISKGAGK